MKQFTSTFVQGILLTIGFMILLPFTIFAQQTDANEWPKDIGSGDYTITLYKPENSSYLDNELKSNLAFALKKGGDEPIFGMLWTTSLLNVDRASRQASLVSVVVDEVRISEDISENQRQSLEEMINAEIPTWNIEFSMDDLLASIEEVTVIPGNYENNPPKILFANEPTALIIIDGKPVFKEADKGYELVENTGALLIKELKNNTYYLKGGEFWYQSTTVMGPWSNIQKAPSKVKAIAKKAEPEKKEDGDEDMEDYDGVAPRVVIATEPTELILFDGEPKYSPLQNTNLLFVENTKSDIFMNVTDQTYYLLISGRWFTTKKIKGDWSYIAAGDLPEDFRKIPADSPKGSTLSNVPGTPEAKEAIYDAQIPQTAAVQRDTKANKVEYNGNPEFKNVEDLNLQYAVNTESAVFKDKNTYYLCDNAVWFKANSPNGPWQVADERPNEIENVPADNPRYNTKYVYIYETSPTVVYVGYTPGYHGSYVYGPTVIYGTGYYYNPWYAGHYYHYHYTYGYSIRYNPRFGWSMGFGYGSPYGWYGNSYWGFGYHHWGPPYYRPPYYYGNRYRRPSHPIYRGRNGIRHYNRPNPRPNTRPGTRPNRPNTRQPSRPTTRENTRPGTGRESRPSTRPESRPSTRPESRPSTRPESRPSTRPETRPNPRPTDRISTLPNRQPGSSPSNRPNTRPSISPNQPRTRQTARPMDRPTVRPATRPSGNRSGRL